VSEEYIAEPPFLTTGMVAGVLHVLNGYLETDAALLLEEGVIERLAEMVLNKVPFDPQMEGLASPTDLFVARTVYWVLQAREALPRAGLPEAVMVKSATVKAKSRRQKRNAPATLEWLTAQGLPLDSYERTEE
jgi:hypothetical protein